MEPVPESEPDHEEYAENRALYVKDRRTTATFHRESVAVRPQGFLLPAEAIKEESEAEKPFLKLHDLEMQESSQSNVTMNSKVALRF